MNSFGPEFLPYWFRALGAALGLALFLLWAGTKSVQWIRQNTAATRFDTGLILFFQCMVIGLMLIDTHQKFGLTPERIPTALEVAQEQGGGDNFCYFRVRLDQREPEGFKWQASNHKKRSIPVHRMCMYQIVEEPEKHMGCYWENMACHPHSIDQPSLLPPGEYRFEFEAVNSWEQTLKVSNTAPTSQLITIKRGGREIWRCLGRNPNDCQPR